MTFNCHILLKNKQSVYFTGQTVCGIVQHTVKNVKTFNKISIHLKGKGKLHIVDKWQRRNHGNRHRYNFEILEDINIPQLSSTGGAKYAPGTYTWPFKIIIPENIPPTFALIRERGRYNIKCRIKHYIQVQFETHGILNETKKVKEEIYIIASVRPRILPVPLIYGNQKTIYGLTCKKTFINIKTFIEKSTLQPGDTVKFSYEVTNNSNINILCIRVKLIEAYDFIFIGKNKLKVFDKTSDVVFKSNKIMRRSTHSESFEICLPKTASSVDFSKIVKRDYHVHICVVLPCLRRNMTLVMPVLVDAKMDESIVDMSNTNFIKNFTGAVLRYEKTKKSMNYK